MSNTTHKERKGKTRFGVFLDRAKAIVPEAVEMAGELITGDVGGAIDVIGSALSKKADKDQEAFEMLNELEAKKIDFALESFKAEAEDREGARDLYKKDSVIQKVFAITFLCGYLLVTAVLLYGLFMAGVNGLTFENYVVSLVTAIFTAMSNKVATIVDFLFGGSV